MDMIALIRCTLDGTKPEPELISGISMEELFNVCESHCLTACAAYALESAGVTDKAFSEAKNKAIRKNILLDAERKKILDRLEAEKIWYMPLKGILIKEWYPMPWMRQMSDNDILFDVNGRAEVRRIMLELGFSCEHYGTSHNDDYRKQPVFNYEMHHELFSEVEDSRLFRYYTTIKNKLKKDEDKEYGYHFSPEDFYLYVTAHEYKHFINGGTGIRTLTDTFVIVREFENALDWEYIRKECEKLGMSEFEPKNRELAMKLFSGEELTAGEQEQLKYYIFSGTYGTQDNAVQKKISDADNSRLRYILSRIFPPLSFIKVFYPFFYRHKWLIPVLWIIRPFKGMIGNRKKIMSEIRLLFRKKA